MWVTPQCLSETCDARNRWVEGAHLVHFGRDFRLPRLSVLTLVDDLSIGYTPPGCLVQKRIPTEVQSFHDVLAEFKYFDSLNSSQLTTTHFDVDWFLESVPVTDGMVRELQPARQVQDIHAIHTQTLSLSLSISLSLCLRLSLSLSLTCPHAHLEFRTRTSAARAASGITVSSSDLPPFVFERKKKRRKPKPAYHASRY